MNPDRCERAAAIDVEAFLVDGRSPDTADFRAHYPTCEDCAEAVAKWTHFDLALQAALADETPVANRHPEIAALEKWVETPEALGARGEEIGRHLDGCPTCSGEVQAMRRFETILARVGETRRSVGATASSVGAFEGLVDRFRATVGPFFGLGEGGALGAGAWAKPASALALSALVVIGIWFGGVAERFAGSPPGAARIELAEAARVEEGSGPEAAPTRAVLDAPESLEGPSEGEVLAQVEEVTLPKALDDEGPTALAEVEPTLRARSAERPAAAQVVDPDSGRSRAVPSANPQEEVVLLAAVHDLGPPTYRRPAGAEDLAWIAEFGVIRSGARSAPIETRAPADHVGLSSTTSPRLWWALGEATDHVVEVLVVDPDALEPALELNLEGPHGMGLHVVDLAERGVELTTGIEYRWFVSLVVDPDRSDQNPVSAGALRVLARSDPRRTAIAGASSAERGHLAAESGLWYDAYDALATLSAAHPGDDEIRSAREALERSSGDRD